MPPLIKYSVYVLLLLVVAPLYTYLSLPIFNFNFVGLPIELLLISGLVAAMEIRINKSEASWPFRIALATAIICGLYILIMFVASWPVFRWQTYKNLLGEVSVGSNFSEDIAPVSLEQIRIVDQPMAERLGDKVLGERPALGSQVYLGTFNIQQVRGKLYWVAPLLHSGFFKWNKNKEGTPGYVMVSATDERDVELVTELNGQALRIRYQPESYFGDYLNRHIYMNGYFSTGTTDFSFEIDEEGQPYWVITLFTHAVGFAGDDAYGIITVHAGTGEIKEYGMDDAPAWVDRIQPKYIMEQQVYDWGVYVNGFWNFSGQDQLRPTEGMSLVYGDDGRSYWYTGVTSVGRDQGTVGFMLIDTRNKNTKFYKQPGATEDAAMLSAMGKVQEKGYYSSFPVMYNVLGKPTYVMSLKDRAGLVKMVAMVSVEDFSVVGVGDNVRAAVRSYRSSFSGSGGNAMSTVSKSPKLESTISRIEQDIVDGTAYYYIRVQDVPEKVFLGSSSVSRKLPLSRVGDRVSLQFDDARPDFIDLAAFDNLDLQTQKTKERIYSKNKTSTNEEEEELEEDEPQLLE